MEQYCDLHTHSHYSDGTFSPSQILAEAKKRNLSAVALTDHNTVAGLPEFLNAARTGSVQAIAGVEISAMYGSTELHIVGLFLPSDRLDTVTDYLAPFNRKKEESNRALIRNLCQAGCILDYEAICRSHPEGTLNRAVIASALLEQGYVTSVSEAFQTLLSKKSGYYIPPQRPDVFDAIRFLRSVNAVPVLAHPLLNLKTEDALRAFLELAVPRGLSAMETMYPSFTAEQTGLARCLAREFGLKESGGSDFHGDTKPHIRLGTGKGTLAVPASFARNLQTDI